MERTPDAIALVCEDQQLTYRELNIRANRLSHRLRKLGVGPEVPAGVCLERSSEVVISLLAILKAGGVYLPLDPAYPKQRIGFMLEDSKASVLITQEHLIQGLPEHLRAGSLSGFGLRKRSPRRVPKIRSAQASLITLPT